MAQDKESSKLKEALTQDLDKIKDNIEDPLVTRESGSADVNLPSSGTLKSDPNSTMKMIKGNSCQSTSSPITITDAESSKARRDLENMVLKYAKSEKENLQNQQKIEELEKKLLRTVKDNDQLANRIKILINDKNQLTDLLSAKVAQLTVLEQKKSHLDTVQGAELEELRGQISKLKESNEGLEDKVQSYKNRESELLDFSERLSMKHVILQTELEETLKKGPDYKEVYESALVELEKLVTEVESLKKQVTKLTKEMTNEKKYSEELRKTKEEAEEAHRKITDELENEIKLMRRKYAKSIKEMTKETKMLRQELSRTSILTSETTTQKIMTN